MHMTDRQPPKSNSDFDDETKIMATPFGPDDATLVIAPNQDTDATVVLSHVNDSAATELAPLPAGSSDNDATAPSAGSDDATVVMPRPKSTPSAEAETVLLTRSSDTTVLFNPSSGTDQSRFSPSTDPDAPTVVKTKTGGAAQQMLAEDTTVAVNQSDRTNIRSNTQDPTVDRANIDAMAARQPKPKTSNPDGSSTQTQTLNPLTNTLHEPFASGGDVIKGRFIIEKVLGQGGMGIVCRAVDLRKVEADDDQPYVAIKLLSSEFAQHADAFKSLQRETKKTQALAHPNIITVYDFDREQDTIFMTMEVLEGHPLDDVIKGKTDVKIDQKTALKIIRQIAQALEYAHSKGIIHSDLKPGNIYYTNTGQVKVLDFGIARAINNERYKDNYDAGSLNAITPKYASLEMFEREPPDPRDDIYALGLIAGELLCNKHPYRGKFATEVKEKSIKPALTGVPNFLYKRLLTQAVAVNRDDRTKSASQFLAQLNWAEKGLKRLSFAAIALIIVLIGNAFIIDSVNQDIPLSDLSDTDQKIVLTSLANADQALSFKDYNGAIVYLDRAYAVHPTNNDIEERVNVILSEFNTIVDASTDPEERADLKSQLQEIGEYEFILRNDNYSPLLSELSEHP